MVRKTTVNSKWPVQLRHSQLGGEAMVVMYYSLPYFLTGRYN
ncbi:hypothetical protein [Cognataquiflexum rubidum]|nr:hypothetical protein [Cognataquiflexum rubidum]